MPAGGKRPGAGRPKGSGKVQMDKLMAREVLRKRVTEQMLPLVDSQIAAALGIKYAVARHKKTGKFIQVTEELMKSIVSGKDDEHEALEVWEKDPSTLAFKDLMDRSLDRPKEQPQEVQVSGTLNIEQRLVQGRKRVADG